MGAKWVHSGSFKRFQAISSNRKANKINVFSVPVFLHTGGVVGSIPTAPTIALGIGFRQSRLLPSDRPLQEIANPHDRILRGFLAEFSTMSFDRDAARRCEEQLELIEAVMHPG